MKTNMRNRICGLILSGIFVPVVLNAQVAQWNFNNTLTGTGSANATAKTAVLGSAITLGDYNSNTVYYGEGGWPAGVLDQHAYLEFAVSPTSSYSLTISSMLLSIRKSTTGTAAGSGPNTWSLRSSVDGFAADISNGTLSTNIVSIPVTFNASYANLSTTVTFRLYGYNATVSTGGLNRFVYDNISISGSTILPVVFNSFKAIANTNAADLTWQLGGEGDAQKMNVERAVNGSDFETIGQVQLNKQNAGMQYTYTDKLVQAAGSYNYRIQLVSADGKISYSPIQSVSFESPVSFTVQTINAGYGSDIRFRVNAEQTGMYQFNLYDMNGMKIGVKQINLTAGTQVLTMNNPRNKSGIYILTAEHAGQQRVTKVAVL